MNRIYNTLQKSLSFQRATLLRLNASPYQSTVRQVKSNGTTTTSGKQSQGVAGGAPNKYKNLPKITLIGTNQLMSVTSLEEAHKLAKRRDLHLIKMLDLDTKTQRPVYKLVTASEMMSQELADQEATAADKSDQTKKSDKSLTIGSRISEHDLASRLKNIAKWLSKRHEVRILVQGHSSDMASSEKIVKTIEESVKQPEVIGKIVQQRTKGSVIKFNIIPVVATPSTSNDSKQA